MIEDRAPGGTTTTHGLATSALRWCRRGLSWPGRLHLVERQAGGLRGLSKTEDAAADDLVDVALGHKVPVGLGARPVAGWRSPCDRRLQYFLAPTATTGHQLRPQEVSQVDPLGAPLETASFLPFRGVRARARAWIAAYAGASDGSGHRVVFQRSSAA